MVRTGGIGAWLERLSGAGKDAWLPELEAASTDVARHPALVEELVAAVTAEADENAEDRPALQLLGVVLDKARMARENGDRRGAVVLEVFDAAVTARAGDFPTEARFALARSVAQAGLPAHDALRLTPQDEPEFDIGPSPERAIEGLLRSLDGEPSEVHASLSEMLPVMDPEAAAGLVHHLAGTAEGQAAALYWLLDRDPALRLAAATGLKHAAQGPLVDIRTWMPADAARDTLDRLIAPGTGGAATLWEAGQVLASLPDGAGAVSIAIPAKSGRTRAVGMVLLKQGFGVADAYLIPCRGAADQKALLGQITGGMPMLKVPLNFVAEAIGAALGDGLAQGIPPKPGLIDLAPLFGTVTLRPTAFGAEPLLAGMAGDLAQIGKGERARFLKLGGTLPLRHAVGDSWFEHNAELEEALETARSEAGLRKAARAALESKRDWWAWHFARAASVLRAAGQEDWPGFALAAEALAGSTPFAKVPLMDAVVEASLAAAASAMEENGGGAAWLEGFVTGVILAPREVEPETWVPVLFNLATADDMDEVQALLDAAMTLYNALVDRCNDPEAGWDFAPGMDEEAFADWAEGFTDAVSAVPGAWPRRKRAADKAPLALLAAAANGQTDPAALRNTIPRWLNVLNGKG